jgi:energy-coupling factor transporter ATP-binding protein EcfA2
VSGELDRRLAALGEVVELAEGRLDPDAVAAAQEVVARGGKRLGLGLETTVVALAGPTGAGKSTLFNALAGAELSPTSRRRPTTGTAAAAIWGDGADALLDWLEVRRRHRVGADGAGGLVVLDLPDFDSVEVSHRLEVERLIGLVDLLVWVVDPQKYADASLHDRYLRALATHRDVMVVVLNQADLLGAEEVASMRSHLERLAEGDGLPALPVLPVSATNGDGVPALRELLAERVASRRAAVERLSADVTAAVTALAPACGERAGKVRRDDRARLHAALGEAAGVQTVVRSVALAHRRRGALAGGWPFLRWVRRFRPDPLRRLRLADRPGEGVPVRTSMPPPTPVHRARVAVALRRLADGASEAMPEPWPVLVRGAATGVEDELADRLDRAVGAADLRMTRPRWWRLAGWLQWLLALVVAAGAVWLGVLVLLGFLQLGAVVPVPEFRDLPVPTLLLAGGALAGVAVAVLARLVNGWGAARRARRAERALRARIEEVADEVAVAPVEQELAAYARLCAALEVARGEAKKRRLLPTRA